MKKIRLAIVSSHPIQYNAPMFALLAKSAVVEPKVFYTWSQSKTTLFDKDFGHEIKWDIPLLEGYDYEFVDNISTNPGPGSFKGIDCPGLIPSLKEWKPDALLVFGWNYKAHFGAMRHFKGKIPVYFRGDSTLIDETGGIKQILRRVFLTWIYRHVDGAFYVGKNNYQYFLKHGLKPQQLFFAPHAIDNNRFAGSSEKFKQQAQVWLNELGIPQKATVALFVGKFESKKNPLILIHAAQKLNNPDLHLLLVGHGMLEDEMRNACKVNPNVHFLPFQNQSQMPVVYHMADFLVLPSQGPGETWGLVINEAMACGKAILSSTRAGSSIDLVTNGENGFVFASGNPDDCVNCLQQITSNPDNLARMGEQSYKMIQKWSFAEIVKSLEKQLLTIKIKN